MHELQIGNQVRAPGYFDTPVGKRFEVVLASLGRHRRKTRFIWGSTMNVFRRIHGN